MVFNTDRSDHSGSHWNVIYVPDRCRFEWYDSSGLYEDVHGDVSAFSKAQGLTRDDAGGHAAATTGSCGHWVLVYCLRRLTGWSKREIVQNTPEDVHRFVRIHFNV